jgi:hypothetical protein
MKKKFVVFTVLLLAMMALLVPAASAAIGSYNTGFQVQNLSDTDPANIHISYVNQDGTEDSSADIQIPAGGSNTSFPIGASAGFDGSVVISSDQPVAAITNILGDGLAYGASYESFSSGAGTVSLPLIMKGNSGFDTWFNVQNTGDSATDVTIDYSNSACSDTITGLAPGAAKTIKQAVNSCLPAGYVGSATATAAAGGEIVATVLEVGPDTLFAYNGFTGGSTSPVAPLINANNAGYVTGVQVQNAGASATDVTINYSPVPGLGTACAETKTVAPGESETFALYAFSFAGDPNPGTDNCAFGAQFVGGATVSQTGSEPIVTIVNQLNIGDAKGSAYNGFDPAESSAIVVMPLIMDRNSGFWTGFNVQNVGGDGVTVTCDFVSSNGGASSSASSPSLDGGDAWNSLQLNALGSGWVGSATCSASAGGSLLAVVNELQTGAAGDQFYAYTAFGK